MHDSYNLGYHDCFDGYIIDFKWAQYAMVVWYFYELFH